MFKRVLVGAGLALFILSACDEPATKVNYTILSPTPRNTVETTRVATFDANNVSDLRPPATAIPPTDTPLPPTAPPTEEATSEPTATEALPTATFEITEEAPVESIEVTAEPTVVEVTPEPTELPASNNEELRALQEDRNILVELRLDENCYLSDQEIPAEISLRNFGEAEIYLYTRGQLLFSINNSPLAPDFPPPAPNFREEFEILALEGRYVWELEDLGLYLRGMGPEAGIDFGDTIFGLPSGYYWLTVAYSNDQSGLIEQIDGTYLIPEAAWRGIAVSRESRFTVVDDLADCPTAD